jgi:ABC-type branched-subunit amino acid transport system ATPase component/predicted MFS family arabinose efflux permease
VSKVFNAITHPIEFVRKQFDDVTAGQLAFPLLVLFLIFFFDEFDTAAFGTLVNDIEKVFHLTDRAFGLIVFLNIMVLFALAIPIGYYGDRLPRKKVVIASAVVAGVFSLATGLAPTLLLLVLFRLGNGVGLLANDPIHRSLLSDYYTPESRPKVYAMHSNAARYGAIFGAALAGILSVMFGWRAAFFVLIIPIVAMAFVARRLQEPVRGGTDDPVSAAMAAEERSIDFGRGVRILMSVRTLRVQYASWVAIGAAYIPLAFLGPIFFHRVFHFNDLAIGMYNAVGAALAIVGVQLAGRWTQGWMAKGLGEPLKRAGWVLVAVGPAILIIAISPWWPLAVAAGLAGFFVGGMFFPPFLTVQSLVSPARVRSLSFSFGSVFLGVGLLIFEIFFGQISDHNVRMGMAVLLPFWIIAGLILRSGHKHVTNDTTRAFAILTATAEMRKARMEASERSILSVRNLDVSYGPVQVLFGVDFEMSEGEIVALLGTNGAGKSTLLKAICGLVPMQGGAIFFDGDDISGLQPEDSFMAGLVQVPGGRGIFPGLTVKENLDVAAWATRRPKEETAGAIKDVLELFPNLARRFDQPAAVLSGGEQQMLTLAQAFIAKPKLLMIDELSLGLAPIVVEELLNIVRRIHDEGTSVILVEQSVNVALTVANRAVFMEKGEVRFTGPTAELLHREDILRAVFLGGAAAAEGVFA